MATTKGKTWLLLELRGEQPTKLIARLLHKGQRGGICETTDDFGIVADYGWAERIVCSGMCREDANDVAHALAGRIGCAAELVEGGA